MRVLEIVALSIWVGAMAAFAFIFAPIAFHTIPDLDIFARLVSQTIHAISYLGFACAIPIAIAIMLSVKSRTRNARAACLALMVASSCYELWAVIPIMQQILSHAGGSIAALATNDPHRIAYDAEHRRSSIVYSVTLLAGFAALVLRAIDVSDAGRAALTREREIGLS